MVKQLGSVLAAKAFSLAGRRFTLSNTKFKLAVDFDVIKC